MECELESEQIDYYEWDKTVKVDLVERDPSADISKEEENFITKVVVGFYIIGIFIHVVIWNEIRKNIPVSKWTYLLFYWGLVYFLIQLNDVINVDQIERRSFENEKIEIVEDYSGGLATLALGISIFVILQRDSSVYKELRVSSILALLGFVVLLIPLSLFWVQNSETRTYAIRHLKTIFYQIGLFLILAFFVQYIVLTYQSYIEDLNETTTDRNKRIVDTLRDVLSEIEVKTLEE